jgi:AraC-like DNA-binding protein
MLPTTPTSPLDLSFRNPSFPRLEVESMRLSELRRRMPASFFRRVQRPRFHLLVLYLDGQGTEEVDFVQIPCRAGTLIHVHPGQVIRYVSIEQAEAYLILFTPEFLWPENEVGSAIVESRLRDDLDMISHVELAPSDFDAARTLFGAIEQEYEATDGGKLSEAIMRHLLMALLLRIDLAALNDRTRAHAPPIQQETFVRFRRELEKAYRKTRAVQNYAQILGCAPRTLNRATLSMAGIPVKQFIDERVALEAKRLLAHTALTVSEISSRLGFTEPTNFVKFFRRSTGLLPGEFRDAQHGSSLS